MDEVNVAVIAPVLGRDLSFASDVDPRVRVFDANFCRFRPPGRTGQGGGARLHGPGAVLVNVVFRACTDVCWALSPY